MSGIGPKKQTAWKCKLSPSPHPQRLRKTRLSTVATSLPPRNLPPLKIATKALPAKITYHALQLPAAQYSSETPPNYFILKLGHKTADNNFFITTTTMSEALTSKRINV
ncbi:hypothetical protein, unlikely [Trypanosoma brucei gambiense DAL972]|uniref:Uncharacterized protein n=1 Tax=Trypanosoma brucei gambiense (strain MHOM/CI/86/DAL972) TaxID=679716 RepID=C9ZJ63_TRYB9|nr:hypothetical protein, unlikely [Trypanosoma brucei gambiense DAL972]CBH09421.1 hypothetical protein, unlikely [Trypanosoma brucei gambiense DAL972]|eukprot:XP_011771727.1 hypothetical protein, unlikely [Trypanosoma brucei gambiense DAL972]